MAAGHRSYRVARLWCATCRASSRARIQIVDGTEILPPCAGCNRVAWEEAPPTPSPETLAGQFAEEFLSGTVSETVTPFVLDDRPVHEVLATPEEVAEFWAAMSNEQQEYFQHRFAHFISGKEAALEAERAETRSSRARMFRELWAILEASTG
jgi:hypothetical protein